MCVCVFSAGRPGRGPLINEQLYRLSSAREMATKSRVTARRDSTLVWLITVREPRVRFTVSVRLSIPVSSEDAFDPLRSSHARDRCRILEVSAVAAGSPEPTGPIDSQIADKRV